MSRAIILLNPSAGIGRALRHRDKLVRALQRHEIDYRLYIPESFENLKTLATYMPRRSDFIVGAGGDGTFNAIANALLHNNPNTILGMINLGTRGDVTREFGTDTIERACEAIKAHQETRGGSYIQTDVGVVKYRELGQLYFLGAVSLGLEDCIDRNIGQFLERFPHLRKFIGLRPVELALGIYFTHKCIESGKIPVPLRVEHDSGSLENRAMMAVLNNARYFDGGKIPSPDASPYDGKIDCCVVGDIPISTLLNDYRLLAQGRHTGRPEINIMQSKWFKFTAPDGIGVQVDGEPIGRYKDVRVSLAFRKLSVLIHPQYARG